jgi:hypothetical protein
MKKKNSLTSRTTKAAKSERREYPHFCTPAAKATPLNGMALRVIIADIRKHKTVGSAAGRRAAETTEND